ncbi:MAG TPA: aminoglycoside phosphotransferase family protein [Nocardioidaceae bacterium]|nr:aminoglycoside phosphotransferase family protein [Nocardioidaceae bacterium]
MHADQLHVSLDMARRLVHDQFPQWRREPLQAVTAQGTVNAVYRIGNGLAARFPLRAMDPVEARAWLESEASACRELASCSPVPTPVPVTLGSPGHGYPLPWAVQTWLTGTDATRFDPARSVAFAEDLAVFITRLRAADTHGRQFRGVGRGGQLPDHDAWMSICFRESEGLLDATPLRRLWRDLRELPAVGPDVMSHGDLMPGNVLVTSDRRLLGVLDGGGFGPADPALDLVSGWHLLDREPRQALRQALGCGDLEWARGRAWALQQAMGLVWYYTESNPVISRVGRRTLVRLLEDT